MKDKSYDVAIVGAGPAGLCAAFILASKGGLSVVVLDQGDDYDSRMLSYSLGKGDLLRGIGGAGTLSGGKLCGIPASKELWRKTWYALPTFGNFLKTLPLPSGAKEVLTPSEIQLADEGAAIYNGFISKSYPSALLLKNDMKAFIRGLYIMAKSAGCMIEAQQAVTDVRPGVDHFTLQIRNGDRDQVFAKCVIFATGRSSAGSIRNLLRRTHARIVSQAPDLGIRLAMPYSASDLFVNCGQDIKLKRQVADTTVRTFCVCTGGDSALINIDNMTYTDGHFTDRLTKDVNVGIVARRSGVVGYQAARHFAVCMGEMLAGKNMTIQEFMKQLPLIAQNAAYGTYKAHIETTGAFLRSLIQIGGITGSLNQCELVGATIDRYWPRIQTNHCFETHQSGLFVIGDAAGIARGYIQSMWSAHCAAHAIIKRIHGIYTETINVKKAIRAHSENVRFITIAA